MAAKTEKSKVLNSFLGLLQCTDNKQQPVASIIDSKVQLHVLSNIPDDFQGVTEIVFDCLPKPSRVNIVTKENVLSSLSAAKYF